MADTPSIDMITADLDRLGQHIKDFNKGAYPAFLFQLHSVLKIHDILEMRLSDVYYCDDGCVRLLPEIVFEGGKGSSGSTDAYGAGLVCITAGCCVQCG